MSSYDTWLNVLTGISQGSFDKIYIRDASGNMVDLLTLLGSIGGGITDVISQSNELVVSTNGSTKILTLNLGGYLSSSHEASNVGAANVAFGAFDINTRTVTLQNSSGVTAVLSVDNGGNLNKGADGVVTIPVLNAWSPTILKLTDSGGTVRNLASSLTGALIWNSSQVATINDLNIYTTTAALTTLLHAKVDDSQVLTNVPANALFTDTVYTHPATHAIAEISGLQTALNAKQATLTASTGIFLSGATMSSYALRWNGSSTPTVPTAIQELHWDNYTVAQNVNLSTGKIELLVGHPTDMATQTWANTQLATKQAAIPGLIYASSLLGLGTPGASFQDHLELRGSSTSLRFNYNGIWTPHSIYTTQTSFSIFSYADWRLYNFAGNPLYVRI